jgi:hypothetical protein
MRKSMVDLKIPVIDRLVGPIDFSFRGEASPIWVNTFLSRVRYAPVTQTVTIACAVGEKKKVSMMKILASLVVGLALLYSDRGLAAPCIGDGGSAQCTAPQITHISSKTDDETDGNGWSYSACYSAHAGEWAAWCTGNGGTWSGATLQCTGLPDGL